MKRMTTLLAAGLVALFAATAAWAEYTLYGSVRSGIVHQSKEGSTAASWDLGSVDAGTGDSSVQSTDKLWSRIGVRASYELDSGMTSGLHIEKRLDNFRTRHQNVWLQGSAGRVTFGQQGSTFNSAVTWDGTNLYGGATNWYGTRGTGIKFATMLDGPFNVEVMVRDDNSNNNGSGDGLADRYEVSASAALGSLATVSAGYLGQDDGGWDAWGGSVGGSVGGLSWDTGYVTTRNDSNDRKRFGAYGGYAMGPGTVYAYYEDLNTDNNTGENDSLLFGYSHSVGTNTKVIVEYQRPDSGQKTTALAVRVDF